MKQIILVIFLTAGILSGKAQDQRPRPSMDEHLKKTGEIFQKELQLNPNQQQKLQSAFKDFMVAAQKVHAENPPPPPPPPSAKVKAAMDKLIVERDAKVKEVLTADQFAKYLEVAKTLHPRHPGGEHGDQAPPPPPNEQK